jgi:pimeloyl-[acyl-carrier protein] methyl ester esterase
MTQEIHVVTIGSGSPLVLLHGWGWHSGIWNPIIHELAQYFQLYLIDLPGCGHSPIINPYTAGEIAKKIFTVVPENAIWLGWSLGGMLAWWIAIHHPEKVSRLITIATSPKFISENNWPGVSPQTLTKFELALNQNYHQTLRDFLDLQLRGSPKNPSLITELHHQLLTSQQTPVAALSGGLNLLRTLDLRADSHKIICPSLHLFGSHDTLVPKEVANLIPELLPQSHCEVIPRAGHIPFLTHTKLFFGFIE